MDGAERGIVSWWGVAEVDEELRTRKGSAVEERREGVVIKEKEDH